MDNIEKVCDYLLKNNNYLILMHDSPDGDTVGSGYALCRALRNIGKNADCACGDTIPDKYGYMTKGVEPFGGEYEHIISVDVADIKLIKKLGEMYKDRIELCIDHHQSNTGYAKNTLLKSDAAATCEIIYEVVKALGCGITPKIAECLYTGITTDTGCFKYSNVTPETHRIAAELMETGIDTAEINRVMFDTKSFARLKVERLALESMELTLDGKCAILVLTDEMQKMAPPEDLEGIKAITRQIEGVQIGITMRQKSTNGYKISIRTHPPFDASAICGKLGGGGHLRAAGCEVELPLIEAKAAVLNAVREVTGL